MTAVIRAGSVAGPVMLILLASGFWRAAAADTIPLIEATLRNDVAQVRQLLTAGSDPDVFDAHRNTALIFAARDGRAEIAELLIAAGSDPDWTDGEQVTPLILASFKNHIAIVRMLLEKNVDRNQRDQWGRTALDYAKRRGRDDPIYRLLAKQN